MKTRRYSLMIVMTVVLGAVFGFAADADSLPLVEYAVSQPRDDAPLVVLVSGDGGWAEIDQELAERWRARGWPVVGLNALKYFWQERTPDEFATDLAGIIRTYRESWGPRPVLLTGFSFGAVDLPFACNRLPDAERAQVKAMVLISPSEFSIWEVELAGWIGGGGAEGPPVAPEIAELAPLPVLILTGESDADAHRRWGTRPGLIHQRWSGGHHLDRAYDQIDEAVASFWRERQVPLN